MQCEGEQLMDMEMAPPGVEPARESGVAALRVSGIAEGSQTHSGVAVPRVCGVDGVTQLGVAMDVVGTVSETQSGVATVVVEIVSETQSGVATVVNRTDSETQTGVATELISPNGETQQGVPLVVSGTNCETHLGVPLVVGSKSAPQRKGNRQYDYPCPLSQCPATMRRDKLKNHVFRRHLPLCFKFTTSWGEMRQEREEAICFLIKSLQLGSWEALFEFVRQKWQSVTTDIADGIVSEMRRLCQIHGWPIPSQFQTKPPNSPAVLIHWRPLLFMVDQLSSTGRKLFRVKFSSSGSGGVGSPAVVPSGVSIIGIEENLVPIQVTVAPSMKVAHSVISVPSQVGSGFRAGSCSGRMGGPSSGDTCAQGMPAPHMGIRVPTGLVQFGPELEPSVPVVQGPRVEFRSSVDVKAPDPLKGFDAHFHLDRMRVSMKSTSKAQVENTVQQPRVPITIIGGVRNYCDPETFHTMPIAVNHPWHLAIGIHPKKAQSYTADQWDFFEKRLALSLVTGICEVGLDYSHAPETWDAQHRLLERILRLGTLGFVLILHVRGTQTDVLGQEVQGLVFSQVKRYCSHYQRIHLHSFSGSVSALMEWFEHFPNCFASFSGLVRTFNPDQIQALRVCPLERMLLETDSPHLSVRPEVRVNTPEHLGEVALLVARLREVPIERIVTATRRNGLQLYFGFPTRYPFE